LQIAVAALAVISMPLSIEAFEEYYGGHATAPPLEIARQVFIAQLLPLSLGILTARLGPALAAWLEPRLKRLAGVLLLVLLVLVIANIWEVVIGAGLRVTLAIVIVTILAVAVGHLLGGPEPATRTATAICSGARNASLALLVATLNAASPAITAAVLTYFVTAFLTLIPYVAWRRRVGALPSQSGSPS
jgi:BASS family bile acid:Na+ symporter